MRRHGTASAFRPSAGRRTTWSCFPTPTSTWPPTPRSTRATARPASAAWRSRSWSRWVPSATSSSAAITERIAEAQHRRRPSRVSRWARSSPSSTATRSRLRRCRRQGGRDRRRRRPRHRAGRAEGFFLGPTLFDNVKHRYVRATDEIFGPVLGVVRVEAYEDARRAWSTRTPTATAWRCSRATAARPGGSSSRSRWAWSASTCRFRCRWRTTPSAAGRLAVRRPAHATAPDGMHFYTRGKVVTSRWPDPARAASTSASRRPVSLAGR